MRVIIHAGFSVFVSRYHYVQNKGKVKGLVRFMVNAAGVNGSVPKSVNYAISRRARV
jgi:hypothetical protein